MAIYRLNQKVAGQASTYSALSDKPTINSVELSGNKTSIELGLQNATITTSGTLTASDWSSNTQTISVSGVTASNTVIVSPSPASFSDYGDAKIYCSAQSAGELTFTCDTTPTNDISIVVVIL